MMFWQPKQRVTPEGWITPDHKTFNDWFVTTEHYRKIMHKPDKMSQAWRDFRTMMFSSWMGNSWHTKEKPYTGYGGFGGGAACLSQAGPKAPSLQDQLSNWHMSYPLLSNTDVASFTAPTDAGGATYNPTAPSTSSTSMPGFTSTIGTPSPTPSVPTERGGPAPAMYYQPDSFPNSYYNNNQHGAELKYNGTSQNWDFDTPLTIDMVFYLNADHIQLNSKLLTINGPTASNQGLAIQAQGPIPANPRPIGMGIGINAQIMTAPGNIPQYKTWHYVRISKKASGKWFGSLDGNDFETSLSNAVTTGSNFLWLGCYSHNFYCWVGWLGYLRIYKEYRDPVNPADYESVLFG